MPTPRATHRIVLVHGFTQTGRSWRHVAADLARDHEVLCPDAPGHGASSDRPLDLWAGAQALGEAGGPACYVGYSMGARLVLHLALQRPDLVTGLVLLGGTAGIDDPQERSARRASDEALADDLERDGVARFLQRWLAQPLFADIPDDPEERDARLGNTAAGLAASLRLAGTGTQDPPLWDRLHEIGDHDIPTLVLAGEHDAKFTALGRRLAHDIGPGARFKQVPGAGHAAHLARPDAFVAIVRAWLESDLVRPTAPDRA